MRRRQLLSAAAFIHCLGFLSSHVNAVENTFLYPPTFIADYDTYETNDWNKTLNVFDTLAVSWTSNYSTSDDSSGLKVPVLILWQVQPGANETRVIEDYGVPTSGSKNISLNSIQYYNPAPSVSYYFALDANLGATPTYFNGMRFQISSQTGVPETTYMLDATITGAVVPSTATIATSTGSSSPAPTSAPLTSSTSATTTSSVYPTTTTSTTSTPSSTPATTSSGLSTGAKVGIAVGVILGVLIISGIILFAYFFNRRLRRIEQKDRSDKALLNEEELDTWRIPDTANTETDTWHKQDTWFQPPELESAVERSEMDGRGKLVEIGGGFEQTELDGRGVPAELDADGQGQGQAGRNLQLRT